jgi:hypothetical protein
MSITFDCPSCGKPIRVNDTAAGRFGTCPNCKTRVRVPKKAATAPTAAVAPPVPKVDISPNSFKEGFLGAFGGFFGRLAAVLVVCVLIGGCLVALVTYGLHNSISQIEKMGGEKLDGLRHVQGSDYSPADQPSTLPTRYVNETYGATIRLVNNGKWQAFNNKSGKPDSQYDEVSRTKDYVEILQINGNIPTRLYADHIEQKLNGNWSDVARGHWEPSRAEIRLDDRAGPHEPFISKLTTFRRVGDRWEEREKSGHVLWTYHETSRTAGSVELFCLNRKIEVRLTPATLDQKIDGKWVAQGGGHWEKSSAVAPAPAASVQQVQPAPAAPQLKTPPPAAPPDPHMVDFKQHVAAFIKEARALARYSDEGSPQTKVYEDRYQTVDNLFTHIPDPPAGCEAIHQNAHKADVRFRAQALIVKLQNETLALTSDEAELKATILKNRAGYEEFAKSQKAALDQIEKDLSALH